MATITERFGFTKPAGSDPASIVPLNSNTDLIELYLGRTQDMIAPLYDDTATYEVDDIVTYESKLYKCITAISTAETFDPTKWEETTAVQEGSGGGGGGTEVIPNPTETPTDTLNTIEIDGVIYEIEGSGGGSIDGGIKTVRIPINNTDSSESINVNVGSSFTSETVDVTHFIKDLSAYQFSGSTSYTCNTVFNSYNNGILNISWGIQSGTSRQYFNIGYIDDLTDLLVLSDWTRYDTDGTYEFVIPSEAQDLTVEGFYVDFRNVKSGGATLALSNVTKFIEDGKLKVTFPFPSGQTVYMECRILYALTGGGIQPVGVHASDIEYDNTTSQLTADNVQDALDEIVANADTASEDILTLQNVQGYDAYDETQTYAVGDYAIYSNHVYECTTAVSTAEPFDSSKWSQTSIEQIIDGVKGDVSQLNSRLTNTNLLSIQRMTLTETTGPTGNIALSYTNDGYTYILGAMVSGSNVHIRAWVSSANGKWYLTAVDPNSGVTINNTSLNLRFLVVKIKSL